jgi:hypothetical protein
MAKQSHTPSRRAILAGIAAAPVAGLPAIADVVAEADPVLAALEGLGRARGAYAQVADDCADDVLDVACEDMRRAEVALYSTAPTTPQGAARLLQHVADFLDEDDVVNDNWVGGLIGAAIRNAFAVLDREARS